MRDARRAFSLKLWDEDAGRLVGFDALRALGVPDATTCADANLGTESR
jgi:hypothetical protein